MFVALFEQISMFYHVLCGFVCVEGMYILASLSDVLCNEIFNSYLDYVYI